MERIGRLIELAGIHFNENADHDVLDLRSELVNLLTFTTKSSAAHIKDMVKSLSDEELIKEAQAIQTIANKIAKAASALV